MRREIRIKYGHCTYSKVNSLLEEASVPKSVTKSSPPVKATKVQLRLRPAQKAVLARAAALRHTSLSNFMLEHACEAAQQVLAEQTDIALSAADWRAFQKGY